MAALRLLKKCPLRREQTDRKDAVKSSLMARAAPSLARTLYSSSPGGGRFTLLPILSLPVASEEFVINFKGDLLVA
ncbi:Uncharacterised protein [Yersinia enterocolitica]|nr:Uncharacterised protein [Yersinia enterocolitica]